MQILWSSEGNVTGPIDSEQVHTLYPWPNDRRWVRAMMLTTLDGGAVGPDGVSKSLTGDGDGAVFNGVRRLADAVLVGAQTVRAEHYQPMRAKDEDQAARAANGQAPAAVVVIVSRSLDLDWDDPLFTESTVPPIVATNRASEAPEGIDVLGFQGDEVDHAALIDALEARGLTRIVCEGGPTLLSGLISAGVVDEADITLAPSFAGNAKTPDSEIVDAPRGFTLTQVLEDDGYLMNRYVAGESA